MRSSTPVGYDLLVGPASPAIPAWTHPSVRALAEEGDPLHVIVQRARQLIFAAMEHGWKGPPFDPLLLAELVKAESHPTQEVFDARARLVGGRPRIEYNPNRPRARVRFSIAHELGHLLFEDFAQQARHRSGEPARPDDWQLEMLCNLAAAEILMPAGAFPEFDVSTLNIDRILQLRQQFEVSMEAALLRVIRLTEAPVIAFAAASHEPSETYRIDYAVGSATTVAVAYAGALLPPDSVVAQCTGVGVTAKGRERWEADGKELLVEAVGIPPYPGSSRPRVVGLRFPRAQQRLSTLTYLRGDATAPRGIGPRIVAHVVNDRTPRWGGGGFAASVRRRWPEVQKAFEAWVEDNPLVLGATHLVQAAPEVSVFSMVAQHGYGPSATPRIRYSALERALSELGHTSRRLGASVHVPRIGTGQAGGKWEVIAQLLVEHVVAQGVDVTVYDPTGPLLPEESVALQG